MGDFSNYPASTLLSGWGYSTWFQSMGQSSQKPVSGSRDNPGISGSRFLGCHAPAWKGEPSRAALDCCTNTWMRMGRGTQGRAVAISKLAWAVVKGDAAPALGYSLPERVASLVSNTVGEHSTLIPGLYPHGEPGISRMLV